MKNKIIIILLFSLVGCSGNPGGTSGSSSGGNNSNSEALVGAILLAGGSLLWKNKETIFKNKSTTSDEVPTNADNSSFRYVYGHTYTPLVSLSDEKDQYGLYTYVLLNKKIYATAKTFSEYRKKAEIILEMSQQYQNSSSNSSSIVDYRNINNFLLPSIQKTKVVTLESYSFKLSEKILKEISQTLALLNNKDMSKTFKNIGPFLITTTKPISQSGNSLYFLYADLTNANVSIVEELMRTYITKLENKDSGNMPFSRLENIKLNIINNTVKLNDKIAVIKHALPGG